MDWNAISKKQLKVEVCYLILMILCLSTAFIGECLVSHGTALWIISNYSNASLVVIQIQATVQTLSIALLTLAASQMTKSYMGIHYNDFQFNLKPIIFTQKRILIGSLVLLMLNVFLHLGGYYNMVIAIFVIVCFLIILSAKEIYDIFAGSSKTTAEIQAYVLHPAKRNAKLEERLNMFQHFCDGWKQQAENQCNNEYDQYLEVFILLYRSIILEKAKNVREIALRECSSIIVKICRVSNPLIRERALQFLCVCYENLWQLICDDKEAAKKVEGNFPLLQQTGYEIFRLICECAPNSIEKNFNWEHLNAIIMLCHYYVGFDENNCDSPSDLYALSELATIMGAYLSNHRNYDYNIHYWGALLNNLDSGVTTWPNSTQDQAEICMANIKFAYAQSLICHDMLDVLKESFYYCALNSPYRLKSVVHARLLIKVHCYLFYLTEYETTDCVSAELKDHCQALLDDQQVKKLFCTMLYRIAELETSKNKQTEKFDGFIFESNLIDVTYKELSRFELYPKYYSAKSLILDGVVQDFIVYITLYFATSYYGMASALERIVPESEASAFYLRYIGNPNLRSSLICFLKMLNVVDPEQKVAGMLPVLQRAITRKIKSHEMARAELAQKEYSAHVNESSISLLRSMIMNHLNETFASITSEDAKGKGVVKVAFLHISSFTDYPIQEIISKEYTTLSQLLIDGLCLRLKQLGAVDLVSKDSFSNDEEYLSYLSKTKAELVIGSEFVFQAKEHQHSDALQEYFSEKTCIFAGFTKQGLLLKKDSISICIKDVKIGVHAGQLNEFKVTFDPKTERYQYEVSSGLPIEFTEKEIKKYLHDHHKIWDIVLVLSIKRDPGKIGSLLYLD